MSSRRTVFSNLPLGSSVSSMCVAPLPEIFSSPPPPVAGNLSEDLPLCSDIGPSGISADFRLGSRAEKVCRNSGGSLESCLTAARKTHTTKIYLLNRAEPSSIHMILSTCVYLLFPVKMAAMKKLLLDALIKEHNKTDLVERAHENATEIHNAGKRKWDKMVTTDVTMQLWPLVSHLTLHINTLSCYWLPWNIKYNQIAQVLRLQAVFRWNETQLSLITVF